MIVYNGRLVPFCHLLTLIPNKRSCETCDCWGALATFAAPALTESGDGPWPSLSILGCARYLVQGSGNRQILRLFLEPSYGVMEQLLDSFKLPETLGGYRCLEPKSTCESEAMEC
jgi:hypothetical protein